MGQAWGTKPIPLMSMSSQKLKFLVQEHFGSIEQSRTLVDVEGFSKRQLVELIAKQRPWHYVHLPNVDATAAPSDVSNQHPQRAYVFIAAIVMFACAYWSFLTRSNSQICSLDPDQW